MLACSGRVYSEITIWNVEKLGHMHQAYVPTVSTTRKPSKSHVNGYCTLLSVSALPRIELVPTFSTCDLLLVVVACFSSFSPVVGIACLNSWLHGGTNRCPMLLNPSTFTRHF